MCHVSAQGVDERMINVHYYFCLPGPTTTATSTTPASSNHRHPRKEGTPTTSTTPTFLLPCHPNTPPLTLPTSTSPPATSWTPDPRDQDAATTLRNSRPRRGTTTTRPRHPGRSQIRCTWITVMWTGQGQGRVTWKRSRWGWTRRDTHAQGERLTHGRFEGRCGEKEDESCSWVGERSALSLSEDGASQGGYAGVVTAASLVLLNCGPQQIPWILSTLIAWYLVVN